MQAIGPVRSGRKGFPVSSISASLSASPDAARPADILKAAPSGALAGRCRLPGDKSISHRALIFGALAAGETEITGLLEGEDVIGTARALEALGAGVVRTGPGAWRIAGCGVQGLRAPGDVLDFGNSGTGVRLMMGVLAGHPFTALLTGDASLRARPMGRVTAPLIEMGAQAAFADGGRLPGTITGGDPLRPIRYEVPVPSAQVKSAVLLAGLHAPGETTVIEAVATRDHTERMLARLGARLTVETAGNGACVITLQGQPELAPVPIQVPGDPSSAAFPLVATLIRPGGRAVLENVMMNPHRTGLIVSLREMGAEIRAEAARESGGEPVADLAVALDRALQGIEVPPERAPSMIDEYPALAVAAAFAEGRTVMHGLGELRVKESDRLAVMATGLTACGVTVEEGPDWLAVEGRGPGGVTGGATIDAHGDHRIAMAFLTLGLGAREPVTVTGASTIATSFPDFVPLMTGLGAMIEPLEAL